MQRQEQEVEGEEEERSVARNCNERKEKRKTSSGRGVPLLKVRVTLRSRPVWLQTFTVTSHWLLFHFPLCSSSVRKHSAAICLQVRELSLAENRTTRLIGFAGRVLTNRY